MDLDIQSCCLLLKIRHVPGPLRSPCRDLFGADFCRVLQQMIKGVGRNCLFPLWVNRGRVRQDLQPKLGRCSLLSASESGVPCVRAVREHASPMESAMSAERPGRRSSARKLPPRARKAGARHCRWAVPQLEKLRAYLRGQRVLEARKD